MGDAFITKPFSNVDPIATIIQDAERRRMEREQKAKDLAKQQENLYKGINIGSDKYWADADAGKFYGPDGVVTKLLDKTKQYYLKNGGKGLNPMQMAEIQTELGNIQSLAGQSLNDRERYQQFIKTLSADKGKEYDYEGSLPLADQFKGTELGTRGELAPNLRPFNPTAFLDKQYTTDIFNNVKQYIKPAKSVEEQEANQIYLNNLKNQWRPLIKQTLKSTGRVSDDELDNMTDAYLSAFDYYAGYDPTTDENQALKQDQFDFDKGYKNALLALKKQGLDIQQQNADTNSFKSGVTGDVEDMTGVNSFIQSLTAGDPAAMERLANIPIPIGVNLDGSPKFAMPVGKPKIVAGADLEGKTAESGAKYDPNKRYIEVTYDKPYSGTAKKIYIPMDSSEGIVKQLVQGRIGKGYNLEVLSKKVTPANDPEDPLSKNKSGSYQSGSNTTKTSYKFSATNTKSGQKIYSNDGVNWVDGNGNAIK